MSGILKQKYRGRAFRVQPPGLLQISSQQKPLVELFGTERVGVTLSEEFSSILNSPRRRSSSTIRRPAISTPPEALLFDLGIGPCWTASCCQSRSEQKRWTLARPGPTRIRPQHRRSHRTGRGNHGGNTNRADTGHLAAFWSPRSRQGVHHEGSLVPGARELLIAANQAGIR